MGTGTFFLILSCKEAGGKFQWNIWTPMELDFFVSVDVFIMEPADTQWSWPPPPSQEAWLRVFLSL